jgi:hypothetical protein
MTNTLETINRMQADGVISLYVLGGSGAATFYIEPAPPIEADIFVLFPSQSEGATPSLAPVYAYLAARGGSAEAATLMIGNWPVGFFPVANGLEREALDESVPKELNGVKTWVMTAEHLVCMALRSENMTLVSQFLESNTVDRDKLHHMLHRHDLGPQWHQFIGTESER